MERPLTSLSGEERRSLRLHQAIAEAILADPPRALALARANLGTQRAADGPGRGEPWRQAWDRLVEGPVETLVAELLSTSTYASQLRQTAPFAGLLNPRERWAAYEPERRS